MADTMKPREPGEDGSTQGQIMTPMCSENVGNKGDGKTKSFKSVVGAANDKSSGNASIEGPGMKGNWDTQISIKGSNKKY
jgi:hypothetical protein